MNATHLDEWKSANEEMKKEGFTWGSLTEKGEENQYMALGVYKIPRDKKETILKATQEIGSVYQKTVDFLSAAPDDLYELLSLPKNTWRAVRVASARFSYITRFDLIVKEKNGGWDVRVIEANCDTPTGIVESSVANRAMCRRYGETSPNALEPAVSKAFAEIAKEYGIGAEDAVHFCSYAWHEEDRKTTEWLMKHSGLNAKYVGIADLRVKPNGVYAESGEKIKYLYRLYPLEYFAQDKGANGEPIGDAFMEHVASGEIKLINPPSAFLGQVKTCLALIWALHESKHPLFTEEEHAIIEKRFLPTYFEREPLEGLAMVEKPIWGREGGGVAIVDAEGKTMCSDQTPYYAEQQKIYQRYEEMPKVKIETWSGEYEGSLLVGSFLIAGEACGIFLRAGGLITGNLSMFVPVAAGN